VARGGKATEGRGTSAIRMEALWPRRRKRGGLLPGKLQRRGSQKRKKRGGRTIGKFSASRTRGAAMPGEDEGEEFEGEKKRGGEEGRGGLALQF